MDLNRAFLREERRIAKKYLVQTPLIRSSQRGGIGERWREWEWGLVCKMQKDNVFSFQKKKLKKKKPVREDGSFINRTLTETFP